MPKMSNLFCNALHLACYHTTTPFSLIQLLLEISPSSVLVQDKFGRTPLRIALERESSTDDVILALIKACPQVAEVNDSDGTSPLSYAVKAGKSLKVTTALREVRPSFVYWKNKMNALHRQQQQQRQQQQKQQQQQQQQQQKQQQQYLDKTIICKGDSKLFERHISRTSSMPLENPKTNVAKTA